MAEYKTISCGQCGDKWVFLERNRFDLIVGPPIIKCSHCGSLNKTNMKLPSQLNKRDLKRLKSKLDGTIFLGLFKAIFYLPMGLGCLIAPLLLLNKRIESGIEIGLSEWFVFILALLFCWGMANEARKTITETIYLIKDIIYDSPSKLVLENYKSVEEEFIQNGGYIESDVWFD